MKRLFIAPLILFLSITTPSWAADPIGSIKGQLVNGTPQGSSVANQEVTLHTYSGEQETGTTTAKTDAEGGFQFTDLKTSAQYSYQVTITYQEAEYNSPKVTFDGGENTKPLVMKVYDATDSDSALKVVFSHVIVFPQKGNLSVAEYYTFMNQGDKTYVGRQVITPDNKKETLRLPVPKNIRQVQYEAGLMECCVVPSPGLLSYAMGVEPGPTEVLFSYLVPASSGQALIARSLEYPTDRFEVLIQGEEMTADSPQLTNQGVVNIEGTRFSRLTGENLPKGAQMSVSISGVPGGDIQDTLKWAVVAAALVTTLGASSYWWWRRPARPALQPATATITSSQKALLQELADLDDRFEAGSIGQAEYHRLRTQRKTQLLNLMQRQRSGPKG
ncbi:MAG: carboxypeptidase regulatory-like domain-containing protein [Chloroflexi bacterium]|nr:carboxypeptidase regulatory-like domain-containing protein [Chloroflexota bacterium]